MDFDFDVCKLSPIFYQTYPSQKYPELLQKDQRPYTCLLIDTHKDYLLCIPFRSDMRHKQGFHFSGTKRSSQTHSGLDYKKMVLLKDNAYIDQSPAVIDADEYRSVMTHIKKIVNDADAYVTSYCRHVSGTHVLHPQEFTRKYQYSTLPYFHDILGLSNP